MKYCHKFLNICILYIQNSICVDVDEPPNLSPSACIHCLKEMLKQEIGVRELVNLDSLQACTLKTGLFNGMEVEDYIG